MRWLEGFKVKLSISVWRILRGRILMYFALLVGPVKGVSANTSALNGNSSAGVLGEMSEIFLNSLCQ